MRPLPPDTDRSEESGRPTRPERTGTRTIPDDALDEDETWLEVQEF